jgi:drug/metabolite transporter (DMT)-like permease
MGRVAPIVAGAPAIPAVFGQLTGEPLTAAQAAGVALIVAGVSMAASESREPSGRSAAGVSLALGSTACFGVGILALDEASASDPIWAALVMRLATIAAVVAAALAVRQYLPAPRERLPTLWLVGLLDAAGVCLFAVATQHGQIGIVAAAAGLVPLVIVLLARVVLDERLRPIQYVGAAAAIVGVGLVSTG